MRHSAKSTCAWRPAGVSKRMTGSGSGGGRTWWTNCFQLRVAAGVAGGADLVEQAHGGQLGVGGEALANDRLIGGQLGRAAHPLAQAGRRDRIGQAAGDPAAHGAAIDAEALGDGGLGQASVQQVFKEHESIPSVHQGLRRDRGGKVGGSTGRPLLGGRPSGATPSGTFQPAILGNFTPPLTSLTDRRAFTLPDEVRHRPNGGL